MTILHEETLEESCGCNQCLRAGMEDRLSQTDPDLYEKLLEIHAKHASEGTSVGDMLLMLMWLGTYRVEDTEGVDLRVSYKKP